MEIYPTRPTLRNEILKVKSLRQLDNLKKKIDDFV
jgi:predicted CoA-binding protein